MTTEINKPGRPKKEVKLDKKQEIRCLDSEKKKWRNAASTLELSVSEYIRGVVNKDADKVIKDEEDKNK